MSDEEVQEAIAVVGIACRYPFASDKEEWFSHLSRSYSALGPVPKERWNVERFTSGISKTSVKTAHFYDEIAHFDHSAFKLPQKEAEYLEPQHRQLLEVTWEAIEDSGLVIGPDGANIGVFTGQMTEDNLDVLSKDYSDHPGWVVGGNARCMCSNRISHFFNFHGPSVSTDTACSSSLIAMHSAVVSLLSNECQAAVVGGANALLSPVTMIGLDNMGILAPDGQSKSFDERADGYGRGEGAGVVILKRLSKAIQDRDKIYCLVRGTASNHNGRDTPVLVAPSSAAQAKLVSGLYRRLNLKPEETSYVEAHGTGTVLGDLSELEALRDSMPRVNETEKLWVSSVKANVGHLEGGSGICGFIKVAMMLQHQLIPGNPAFRQPPKDTDLDALRVIIPTSSVEWTRFSPKTPLRGGLNSFGIGGSNVHVILEEYFKSECPSTLNSPTVVRPILSLSATNTDALIDVASRWRTFLKTPDIVFHDILYTASMRRNHHSKRLAVWGDSPEEVAQGLLQFLNESLERDSESTSTQNRSTGRFVEGQSLVKTQLAMVFVGQGAEYVGMGRHLLSEPIFLDTVRKCDKVALGFDSGKDLSISCEALLHLEDATSVTPLVDVHDPLLAQYSCTVLQIALVNLLAHWGITPNAVVGHSSGEIAAAYAAGFLNLDQAVKTAFLKGLLVSSMAKEKQQKGGMAVVWADKNTASDLISADPETLRAVRVACVNSPTLTTVSGDLEQVTTVVDLAKEKGLSAKVLESVEVAYHSHHCYDISKTFRSKLASFLHPRPSENSSVVMYSSVTGNRLPNSQVLDHEYWGNNLVTTVEFSTAVISMLQNEENVQAILQIGPHGALSSPLNEIVSTLPQFKTRSPPILSVLDRRHSDLEGRDHLFRVFGELFVVGFPLQWGRFLFNDEECKGCRHSDLPKYPFQHKQLRVHGPRVGRLMLTSEQHPLLGNKLDNFKPTWEKYISSSSLDDLPVISDHKLRDAIVWPGAGYLEMCVKAAEYYDVGEFLVSSKEDLKSTTLNDVKFTSPLFLNPEAQTVESSLDPQTKLFQVHSTSVDLPFSDDQAEMTLRNLNKSHRLHFSAQIRKPAVPLQKDFFGEVPVGDLLGSGPEKAARILCQNGPELDINTLRQKLSRNGVKFGPEFQRLKRGWKGDSVAVTEIRGKGEKQEENDAELTEFWNDERIIFSPSLLDAAFQTVFGALPSSLDGVFVPSLARSINLWFRPPSDDSPIWCFARVHPLGSDTSGLTAALHHQHSPQQRTITADICLVQGDQLIMNCQELQFFRVEGPGENIAFDNCHFLPSWKELAPKESESEEPSLEVSHNNPLTPSGTWLLVGPKKGGHIEEALRSLDLSIHFRSLQEMQDAEENMVDSTDDWDFSGILVQSEPVDESSGPANLSGPLRVFKEILRFHSKPSDGDNKEDEASASLKAYRSIPIFVVTEGCMMDTHFPSWSGLIGLARTFANEAPWATVSVIDLDVHHFDKSNFLALLFHPSKKWDCPSPSLTNMELCLRGDTVYWLEWSQFGNDEVPKDSLQKGESQSNDDEKQEETVFCNPNIGEYYLATLGIPPPLAQPPPLVWESQNNYVLRFSGLARNLSALVWQEEDRPKALDPKEIEVEVHFTGLNFKDAMIASGFLDEAAFKEGYSKANVGLELSGIVTRAGDDTSFDVGEKVTGVPPPDFPGFSRYVIVTEDKLIELPADSTLAEASGFWVAASSAYHAIRMGHLEKDETVLIHSAAGAVGLWSIQIAREKGAFIFATASTDEKRQLCLQYGADVVMNSRTLDFVHEIRQHLRTRNGATGVDVVINSLSGRALEESIKLLAPFGRFIEIGKRDIMENKTIEMKHFISNATYSVFDLDRFAKISPLKLFPEELKTLVQEKRKEMRFPPITIYPAHRIRDAFNAMYQAQHLGKIVVQLPGGDTSHEPNAKLAPIPPDGCQPGIKIEPNPPRLFPTNATYLIVGGTRGLGIFLAEWMVSNGARSLILAGISGNVSADSRLAIDRMENAGASVTTVKMDACNPIDVNSIVKEYSTNLTGIIFSAMVLSDGPLVEMTSISFSTAYLPKALGAWNLHQSTCDLHVELDFFICLSSVSSVFGNIHQANYNAGNVYMEELCRFRKKMNLPSFALNLGPVSEIGVLSSETKTAALMQQIGIYLLAPHQVARAIEIAITSPHVQGMIAGAKWTQLSTVMPSLLSPKLKRLLESDRNLLQKHGTGMPPLLKDLISIRDRESRKREVMTIIFQKLKEVIDIKEEEIDLNKPLMEFGIDSMQGMEIKNWVTDNLINADFDVTQAPTSLPITPNTTVGQLVELLMEEIDKQIHQHRDKLSGVLPDHASLPSDQSSSSFQRGLIRLSAKLQAPTSRVICFPGLGGAAQAFRSFPSLFPDAEILLLDFDFSRFSGSSLGNVIEFLSRMVWVHLLDSTCPVILCGHSVGCWLALEVARFSSELLQKHATKLLLLNPANLDFVKCLPASNSQQSLSQALIDFGVFTASELPLLSIEEIQAQVLLIQTISGLPTLSCEMIILLGEDDPHAIWSSWFESNVATVHKVKESHSSIAVSPSDETVDILKQEILGELQKEGFDVD